MRLALAILFVVGLSAGQIQALEFPGTCRGPKATVTKISGIDTPAARMTARHTRSDAIAYCTYELSSARQRAAQAAELDACVERFMRERRNVVQKAEANCREGTLVTMATGLPTSVFPRSSWTWSYIFPIPAGCGNDNLQAIAVFRRLCPSYRSKIRE